MADGQPTTYTLKFDPCFLTVLETSLGDVDYMQVDNMPVDYMQVDNMRSGLLGKREKLSIALKEEKLTLHDFLTSSFYQNDQELEDRKNTYSFNDSENSGKTNGSLYENNRDSLRKKSPNLSDENINYIFFIIHQNHGGLLHHLGTTQQALSMCFTKTLLQPAQQKITCDKIEQDQAFFTVKSSFISLPFNTNETLSINAEISFKVNLTEKSITFDKDLSITGLTENQPKKACENIITEKTTDDSTTTISDPNINEQKQNIAKLRKYAETIQSSNDENKADKKNILAFCDAANDCLTQVPTAFTPINKTPSHKLLCAYNVLSKSKSTENLPLTILLFNFSHGLLFSKSKTESIKPLQQLQQLQQYADSIQDKDDREKINKFCKTANQLYDNFYTFKTMKQPLLDSLDKIQSENGNADETKNTELKANLVNFTKICNTLPATQQALQAAYNDAKPAFKKHPHAAKIVAIVLLSLCTAGLANIVSLIAKNNPLILNPYTDDSVKAQKNVENLRQTFSQ